jgi:hypothetical protein
MRGVPLLHDTHTGMAVTLKQALISNSRVIRCGVSHALHDEGRFAHFGSSETSTCGRSASTITGAMAAASRARVRRWVQSEAALTTDSGIGVVRHAQAGCEISRQVCEGNGPPGTGYARGLRAGAGGSGFYGARPADSGGFEEAGGCHTERGIGEQGERSLLTTKVTKGTKYYPLCSSCPWWFNLLLHHEVFYYP